jgi:transposase-like protein
MALPADPAKLDHAFALYKAGKSVSESAAAVGIGTTTLHRKLREAGLFENRRLLSAPPNLAEDFLGGESVKALATRHGISRRAIYRMLREQGVDGRDRSTAMTIRWQRATPEQRKAMLATAHEATRRPQTAEHRIRIAAGKEGRPLSADEVVLADFMRDRGYTVELGVPCGKYNLDLLLAGTVAVEIFGGGWHSNGRHRDRFAERSRYILDSGYSLAIVWADKGRYPLSVACAQHLDTLVQITRGNPSIRRQHWVIRGDGYFLAAREDDGHEVPFVNASGSRDD